MLDLKDLKKAIGLIEKNYCDEEEATKFVEMVKQDKKLPDDVHTEQNPDIKNDIKTKYYRYKKADIAKEEYDEYIELLKLDKLTSIDSTLTFFKILVIINLCISVIILIVLLCC